MPYWAMPAWIFASSSPKSGSAVGAPATAALAGVQRAAAVATVRTPAAVVWRNRRRDMMSGASVGGGMETSSSLVVLHCSHFELAGRPGGPDDRWRGGRSSEA